MASQGSPTLILQEENERLCAFMTLEVNVLNSAEAGSLCLAEARCQLGLSARELLCVRKLNCNYEQENPISC